LVTFDDAVDEVFRALADPNRRALLDALRARDGQTLTELCRALPAMTRFGVMKHLGVLESAHLVATRREGREKLHFLNPVPIREIHDRWISKFAEPWAAAMVDLKRTLEQEEACPPVTSSRRTSKPRPNASGRR
jgi:DNA-binding transcriptional ArsR family regulator